MKIYNIVDGMDLNFIYFKRIFSKDNIYEDILDTLYKNDQIIIKDIEYSCYDPKTDKIYIDKSILNSNYTEEHMREIFIHELIHLCFNKERLYKVLLKYPIYKIQLKKKLKKFYSILVIKIINNKILNKAKIDYKGYKKELDISLNKWNFKNDVYKEWWSILKLKYSPNKNDKDIRNIIKEVYKHFLINSINTLEYGQELIYPSEIFSILMSDNEIKEIFLNIFKHINFSPGGTS